MQRALKIFFLAALLLSAAAADSVLAGTHVDVNIGIGVPPPLPRFVLPGPPELVVIPRSYAYFVPDVDVDIVFFGGYWWRPYQGFWYRSHHYNGPWKNIHRDRVPRGLMDLPPDYRRVPPGHQRLHHNKVKSHWREWERDRYWDRHDRWEDRRERREHRRDHRREEREERREDRREHGRGRY